MLHYFNRLKYLLLFLPFLICSFKSDAQNTYWIFLKDKKEVTFDPYQYYDQKAIERRLKNNIPLIEFSDLPLNTYYSSVITSKVSAVIAESRWLNAIIADANDEEMEDIRHLPFVTKIEKVAPSLIPASISYQNQKLSPADSALLIFQTFRMKGELFKEREINGKGIRIAIFDTGFPGVDTHPAFKHLRDNNQIIKTYDFLKNQDFVYGYFNHGTMVLSNIAGKFKDINIGLAPGAEFLLARTERAFSEVKNEEYTWVLAAEWSERNGADIISSSLGYSYHRYFQNDLDGKTSYVAKAANIAASKGVLVINSAGNEASNRWRYIVTPADADNVLAVGGTDPYTDIAINFSSIGPGSDYRLKPNVSALGTVIAATKTGYTETQGTSFSAPLVTGFAACMWQANPELTNMEVFKLIEQSGHLYPYFDYGHGYGIPQADKALRIAEMVDTTFNFIETNDDVAIKIKHEATLTEIETEGEDISVRNLYYKFTDESGKILKYAVIVVTQEQPIIWDIHTLQNLHIITVHYEGFTNEYLIKK